MTWDALTALAASVSTVALIVVAFSLRASIKNREKTRALQLANDLFAIWQSQDFMEAQLWLLHRLEERTWKAFVAAHRCDAGEVAFHRVGSFYDRVGTLVRLGLVDEKELLSTMGGHAIAVWRRIEPLVDEARRIENSVLFSDFERLLPACHACYVPALPPNQRVAPFSIEQAVPRMSQETLRRRLDDGGPGTILDVRLPVQMTRDRRTLPKALLMPPDKIERRYSELSTDTEVVVYCASPHEETSSRVAYLLQERGYRASALLGGFEAWRDADLPLDGG